VIVGIAWTRAAQSPCERRRSRPLGEPSLNRSALAPRRWVASSNITAGVTSSPLVFKREDEIAQYPRASRAESSIAGVVEVAETELSYHELRYRAKRRKKGCRRYSLRSGC
jgi:hypothetical protein